MNDDRRPKRRDAPSEIVCYKCGEKGNKSNVCGRDERKCFRCGQKGHNLAECKRGDIVYYNCNEEGHISSQCTEPKKVRTGGKVFALTGTQTTNEDRLIRGTCFFNSTPLIAIIDTGATHCFIALESAYKLGLIVSDMKGEMVVETPAKGSVTTSLVCLGYPISMFGRDFVVDLVCLPLSGMDVIFGMNWLEYNRVHINCFSKTVHFSSAEEEGEVELLSTKQMKQFERDGILMYSLMAYLSVENQAVIGRLPVVNEFPKVFPDEIPDVPPEREVEFSIDLVPGTKPVSMAPYRMSASELAELKKQLKDLLDKKFVRPSVSPWGAPVLLVKKKDGSMRLCIDYRQLNMRQRRWLELLKDYDFGLNYHPGKANVVADALSRKTLHMSALMVKEFELLEQFRDLSLVCELSPQSIQLGMLKIVSNFLNSIREAQKADLKFVDLMTTGSDAEDSDFKVDDQGFLRFRERVCISDNDDLKKLILEESHKSRLSIHPGATKMYHDLKKLFWWSGLKRDVAQFVYACLICQKSKVEHQKPTGLMTPLDVPEWKWDSISMDFVTSLPNTPRGHDAIWVVVDRLTKSAHFIPINISYPVAQLAEIYVHSIVKLHGVPSSIVSDKDPRFTSRFWKSLQDALGSKLRLSSTYHPQTDGQSERTIQSLEDLLRVCVLEQGGAWDSHLPLIEFTYNNSYHSSIGMAPFEALYGRRCRTPLCWFESGESVVLGPNLVHETTEKVRLIREKMKASQSRQKSYHDKRRKALEFQEGDHVFLRVTPLTGVGRALKSRKLTPKFIGSYQISERVGTVAYRMGFQHIFRTCMMCFMCRSFGSM
ncbi:putative nucleotidyltransferase, Ribonuclease H [Medicago truncatula]|uniref:Putative nucleotidyltransferase, Ribonuclease H n=1 Tax=Medicago truncatula TaxID=3880 RepID=A0A396I4T5_MEDTR|nr:putative nucleotidyltransferase, Ribonuclease H [Medicago truncatula]